MEFTSKCRIRPEISPKFFSQLGSNPTRAQPEPDPNPTEKPGPTYNSGPEKVFFMYFCITDLQANFKFGLKSAPILILHFLNFLNSCEIASFVVLFLEV